jgi:gamma-glutamylaminecyclotransferase
VIPSKVHRLFVYGTLMRGFCRHGFLKGQTFVQTAMTRPKYRLINLGDYPGLVETADQGRQIHGEVWEVSEDALAILDEVEGTDAGLYERRHVNLEGWDSDSVEAYFYLGHIADRPDCGDRWSM